jgi:hypothetical protein
MPKPGNRSANRLVIRFVTAKLKAATQRLRNLIRRKGASRIARSEMMAVIRLMPHTLLQLGVFRFGFLQDGDVGVGVFPEGKKSSGGRFEPSLLR